MELYASVTASVLLLACASFIGIGCAACKKIFKKKQKYSPHDGVSVEDGQKKDKNGIANPNYNSTSHLKQESDFGKETNDGQDEERPDNKTRHLDRGASEPDGNDDPPAMDGTPKILSSVNSASDDNVQSTVSSCKETSKAKGDGAVPTDTSTTTSCGSTEVQVHQENQLSTSDDVATRSSHDTSSDLHKSTEVEEDSSKYADVSLEVNVEPLKSGNDSSASSSCDNKAFQSEYDGLTLPNGWRLEVKLKDLLELGLIDSDSASEIKDAMIKPEGKVEELRAYDTIKSYLFGEDPIAGIIHSDSGEKKSIYQSAKEGLLRRDTAISWLEAQAATGNLLDPINGRKISVAEGRKSGLYDKVYDAVVSRAERAVTGYRTRVTKESLPFGQAIARGLIIESHGLRLLEAQLATGGIIDHLVNIKVPLNMALERALVDENLAQKLTSACEDVLEEEKAGDLKFYSDPNTRDKVTYGELMRRCVRDDVTGMLLYPLLRRGKSLSRHSRASLMSSRTGSSDNLSSLSTSP